MKVFNSLHEHLNAKYFKPIFYYILLEITRSVDHQGFFCVAPTPTHHKIQQSMGMWSKTSMTFNYS